MKIALAQINPTVGDFAGNTAKMLSFAQRAREQGADLAVFPELSLMGYPPRDLLDHADFVRRCLDALEQLARECPLPALVGYAARNESGTGRPLRNAVALLRDGRAETVHSKMLLPSYDVFDEERYFEPGEKPQAITLGGCKLGVTVCEDIWRPALGPKPRYRFDPVAMLALQGIQALLNLSASPFTLDKPAQRHDLLAGLAKKHRRPLIYVNQAGGNDELIFDGASMVFNERGELVAKAKSFDEDLLVVNLDALPAPVVDMPMRPPEAAFRALALGTRDYLGKCGFKEALLGLSGGIDSAVTAAIAAEALGPQNVLGVMLPSRFSSSGSLKDAKELVENLGIRSMTIPIEPVHHAALESLAPAFAGRSPDLAEENIQARIRGMLLMALSNKFGMLLLTTGNKSELATGYCTLYGDMCGGLAPISDAPKMLVYDIACWLNRNSEVIPANSISKPPSAELRPNQTDQDTLPPYELVDKVLHAYIEEGKSVEEIIASGVEPGVVKDVVRRIESSEYKRRQATPGLKITSRAFGYGRRIPVAKKMSTD